MPKQERSSKRFRRTKKMRGEVKRTKMWMTKDFMYEVYACASIVVVNFANSHELTSI